MANQTQQAHKELNSLILRALKLKDVRKEKKAPALLEGKGNRLALFFPGETPAVKTDFVTQVFIFLR